MSKHARLDSEPSNEESSSSKKCKVDSSPTSSATTTTTTNMYPNKIMWATIFTRSVKNSASWFEKALGFKPGFMDPGENWAEIKAPEASNIAFHVTKKNGEEGSEMPEGTIQLTLTVKDLKNYHDFVKDVEGIKILRPPTKEDWGGFNAVYQAPDGARFSVIEDHFSECENKDKPKEAEKEVGGGFCHLEIFAEDMGRARKFYSDVFGFTFTAGVMITIVGNLLIPSTI